ncbi:ABC transporter permease [Qaidamihabitans albus]|uniref:ABC transporter permease n=1 Tax=Qaidamihabitans albus TaxID=2795733 RepID=UPI0018F20043|nr:ABC transporter permease [Qaidamihabitans albus]
MTATEITTADERTGGGLHGAIHAEWTKLWSVRSTWWTVSAAALLLIGYTALAAISVRVQADNGGPEEVLPSAPQITTEAVFFLAQYAVLAVATLFVAGEYATGGIRATLQWVPDRTRVLLAKCAALLPALFALGAALAAVSLVIAVPAIGGAGGGFTVGEGVRASLAVGTYWALLGAFALGIGTALRSVAGALTVSFVALVVLPMLCGAVGLPAVIDYLPGIAGLNLMLGPDAVNNITGQPVPYPGWAAVALLAAWSGAALAVGNAVLRNRDAG